MKNRINKKSVIILGSIILCIIIIFGLIYSIKILNEKNLEKLRKETEEKENNLGEYELLEKNFDDIFLNDIKNAENISEEIKKVKESKKIVYTKYQGDKKKENKYTVNVKIPYININNKLASKYNKEIEEIFVEKLKKVMTEAKNEIYTVEYTSNIQENILSIVIKSTLKQEGGTQRIINKTYCFDIKEESEIKLQDILKNKKINEEEVQDKIIQKIKEKQNEALALEQLGYEIYTRDYTDKLYQIKNITDFYMDENGYIYIIFAYGNNNSTGEMDIIII